MSLSIGKICTHTTTYTHVLFLPQEQRQWWSGVKSLGSELHLWRLFLICHLITNIYSLTSNSSWVQERSHKIPENLTAGSCKPVQTGSSMPRASHSAGRYRHPLAWKDQSFTSLMDTQISLCFGQDMRLYVDRQCLCRCTCLCSQLLGPRAGAGWHSR